MMCVVTKAFTGNGEEFGRNELIDGSQFRNESVLISQRFLRPATNEDIEAAELADDDPAPAPPPRKSSGLKARKAKKR